MLEIKGSVEKIIYKNDDNGYTIARLLSEGEDLIIVGYTSNISEGIEYLLSGEFTFHKRYGEQFNFSTIEEILPKSKEGIINYLSSGVIPFIGEKMAKSIVKTFGEDTLEILDKEPKRLLEVEGIGKKKYEKILASLDENKALRNLMVYFTSLNIGVNIGVKIYREYGEEAIKIIKENPYRLADDISGIGFKKADEIALKMGDFKNSSYRYQSALKYTLTQGVLEGHSFLPKDVLISRTLNLIETTRQKLEEEILKLSLDDRFYIENRDGQINCYYAPYLRAENYIAGKIKEILRFKNDKLDYETYLKEVEKRQNLKLGKNQKLAVKSAIENGILIITGGPGTGKTTTLKVIIEIFELLNKSVTLAAPTGRAAKRMKEATGREASTIHRLLELGYGSELSTNYGYEEETEISTDVLIIDEVSMVDLFLMNTILKSIKPQTRLILVGDKDQLPSVGAGNVLSDLINSKIVPVVSLNEIFRQKEESLIIKNAHLINNGIVPEILNKNDFYYINSNDETNTKNIITSLVSKRLPSYYGYNSKDIQVLSPMKKGEVGVITLNNALQKELNKNEEKIEYSDRTFKIDDKVIQMKNNYSLSYKIESSEYYEQGEGIFNGDIGHIVDLDEESKEITVLYDEYKKVQYEYEDIEELSLAYATTIHKSQGSEFDVVIIPLHKAPYILLTRNLIYTAITRAKKLVVLVGEYKYLEMMVKNNKITRRYSNLDKKLKEI